MQKVSIFTTRAFLCNRNEVPYRDSGVKTCFHNFNIYDVVFMHITTFGRNLVVLRALFITQPQTAWMPAELQTAMEG